MRRGTVANTINNTKTVANPMEENERQLEELVETGQLMKEGQQRLNAFLEVRTAKQVLEVIDCAIESTSLSKADALAFLEQIETGVNWRMADLCEELTEK
jgi:hypothetical protein